LQEDCVNSFFKTQGRKRAAVKRFCAAFPAALFLRNRFQKEIHKSFDKAALTSYNIMRSDEKTEYSATAASREGASRQQVEEGSFERN